MICHCQFLNMTTVSENSVVYKNCQLPTKLKKSSQINFKWHNTIRRMQELWHNHANFNRRKIWTASLYNTNSHSLDILTPLRLKEESKSFSKIRRTLKHQPKHELQRVYKSSFKRSSCHLGVTSSKMYVKGEIKTPLPPICIKIDQAVKLTRSCQSIWKELHMSCSISHFKVYQLNMESYAIPWEIQDWR